MRISNEIIRSKHNKTLMQAASLCEKKYRDALGCFSADGYKLFEEAVKAGADIPVVFVSESKTEQFLPNVKRLLVGEIYENTVIQIVSDDCFFKLTKEKSPQGIITIIKYLDKIKNNIKIYKVDDYNLSGEKILVLSSLRDPSNLGAILRSAVAFGTKTVIASSDCADIYQPKAVRSAMGALFRIQMLYCDDLASVVTALRLGGRRVFAAELTDHAVSIDEIDTTPQDIVVIGNEGHGITKDVSLACDASVYLPISKDTESLNAAVAASVFLWELRS